MAQVTRLTAVIERIRDQFNTLTALVNSVGAPAGGTTGQVLKKVDGTDFNTEWGDESPGDGSTNSNLLIGWPSNGTDGYVFKMPGLTFSGIYQSHVRAATHEVIAYPVYFPEDTLISSDEYILSVIGTATGGTYNIMSAPMPDDGSFGVKAEPTIYGAEISSATDGIKLIQGPFMLTRGWHLIMAQSSTAGAGFWSNMIRIFKCDYSIEMGMVDMVGSWVEPSCVSFENVSSPPTMAEINAATIHANFANYTVPWVFAKYVEGS